MSSRNLPVSDEAAKRIRARANVDQLLTTAEAAELLRLNPQTLRKWACKDTGPIKPRRFTSKLLWSADEIRVLVST
jgi:hypothetical protein